MDEKYGTMQDRHTKIHECYQGYSGVLNMESRNETHAGEFQAIFRSEKILWFLLIGALSSLIDLGLLYYFTSYLGVWYIVSASASYCCGIFVSYSLNKYLTFHDTTKDYFTQFSTFAAVSISCLVMNLCIIWLMVELLSVHYLLAKVCGISAGFLWNYYGQSAITFRNGRSRI
jgi:putative flippase GtrA